jgi:tannase
MHRPLSLLAWATAAYATSLRSACTVSHIRESLPEGGYILGVTFDHSSVTVNPVYNASHSGEVFFPDATINYCNVTFSYTHTGSDQSVILGYYMPSPTTSRTGSSLLEVVHTLFNLALCPHPVV